MKLGVGDFASFDPARAGFCTGAVLQYLCLSLNLINTSHTEFHILYFSYKEATIYSD